VRYGSLFYLASTWRESATRERISVGRWIKSSPALKVIRKDKQIRSVEADNSIMEGDKR